MVDIVTVRDSEIRYLYKSGIGIHEVAAMVGCCAATVLRTLSRLRVPTRTPGRRFPPPAPEKIENFKRMYQSGLSVQQIANEFGLKHGRVRKALTGRVKFRTPGESRISDLGESRCDYRAVAMVNREIARGKLRRADACETCGKSGKMRDGRSIITAHHDDYNKPLNVKWLCGKCHMDWHRVNRAVEKVSICA